MFTKLVVGTGVFTAFTLYKEYNYKQKSETEPFYVNLMLWPSTETIKNALRKEPTVFATMPEKWQTQEICDFVVSIDPLMYEFIPDKFKTIKMDFDAVEANFLNLDYVPDDKLTPKFLDSVTKNKIGAADE